MASLQGWENRPSSVSQPVCNSTGVGIWVLQQGVISSPIPPSCPNSLLYISSPPTPLSQVPFAVTHLRKGLFHLHSVRLEFKKMRPIQAGKSSRVYQLVSRNVSVFCENKREGGRKGPGTELTCTMGWMRGDPYTCPFSHRLWSTYSVPCHGHHGKRRAACQGFSGKQGSGS